MKRAFGCACLLPLVCLATAVPFDPRFPRTGKEWTPESLINPEELGEYFEGDILLPLPTMGKNGLIDENYRWPEGKVAYHFHSDYTEDNKKRVREAMRKIEEHTGKCITFHERTHEQNFIIFTHDNFAGCFSMVGMQGCQQQINYPDWCIEYLGTMMHEMLHALGFYHEQSRYDRDDYVTIVWENIASGMGHNFKKYSSEVVTGFGEDYDYSSVMHYGPYAFTTNGMKTIVTKDPNAQIGQREDLSEVDVKKLMKMYNC
ncbi:zinc metalloproteinase nas-4-like [Scylla paramamosain]|uniref:zinc metalloproteinase nas-4-like n=1 Tax=Scylla paramamosain TaxID=85552 RepID=UPI0030835D85